MKPLLDHDPNPGTRQPKRTFPCEYCRVDIGKNYAVCPQCVANNKRTRPQPQQQPDFAGKRWAAK